jgi:putative endonuclease
MKDGEGAFLYILRCADGSYYIGITRTTLEVRIAQHNAGALGGYTETRRPVTLVYSQWFERITDAIENERKPKEVDQGEKGSFYTWRFCSSAAACSSSIVEVHAFRRLS